MGRKKRVDDLAALAAAIRSVNPTGRALSRREEERRYEEKARLQSQLIELAPEEVRVREHEDMPGVFSLALPRLGVGAGHAVLDALSVRARALILDGAVRSAPPVFHVHRPVEPDAQQGQEPSGASPMEHVAALLAEYDFECAERELRSLVREGAEPIRSAASERLVTLLIDELGREEDALAWAAEATPWKRSAGVQRSLALAALRSGQIEPALEGLREVGVAERREAVSMLVARAVKQGAWRIARDSLELLRRDAFVSNEEWDASRVFGPAWVEISGWLTEVAYAEVAESVDLRRVIEELAPQHVALVEVADRVRSERVSIDIKRNLSLLESEVTDPWEHALAALQKHEALLGVSERALVARRRAALEGLRVSRASRRWAECSAWEDPVLAFLRSPPHLREQGLAAAESEDQRFAFRVAAAVEAQAPSAHATVRAVRAAVDARGLDAGKAWVLVRPHLSLLASVDFLAADLARWEAGASAASTETLGRGTWPSCAMARAGLLSISLTSSSIAPSGCQRGIAARTLRARGSEWIVHVLCWDGHVELWLRNVEAPDDVVGVLLGAPEPFRLNRVLVHEDAVLLVDMQDRCYAVTWASGVAVEARGEVAPLAHDASLGLCGNQVVLRATAELGARREAVMAGCTRPFTVRSEGSTLIRTDARSGRREDLEMPKGVSPHLVVESPRGEGHPPLIVEQPSAAEPGFVWWRPQRDLWRGFRLEAGVAEGAPTEAHGLPGRGVMVVTRDRSGLLVQRVCVERGGLVAGEATRHDGAIGVVLDAARRRCWLCVLDRNESSGFRALPLRLEPRA